MNAERLLQHSYENNLSHIPSALSMLDYITVLFKSEIVKPYRDHIVIGKPFGAQAYYLVWKDLNYLGEISDLSIGVKHDEIFFVDYGEETMGNALGVATGIAIANPDKRVWVNITDACLQMGNVLEALQFIGHNRIKNIFVTVDFNNSQVTGKTSDVLDVNPIVQLCRLYGWWVQEVDGHNRASINQSCNNLVDSLPNVIFFKTRKGYGVQSMEQDLKKWHYKKIETFDELQLLVAELPVT